MIENCKGMLKRAGFQKEHLKEEVYWIPEKVATRAIEPAKTLFGHSRKTVHSCSAGAKNTSTSSSS